MKLEVLTSRGIMAVEVPLPLLSLVPMTVEGFQPLILQWLAV